MAAFMVRLMTISVKKNVFLRFIKSPNNPMYFLNVQHCRTLHFKYYPDTKSVLQVADEEDLRKAFESCGTITSLRIIRDKTRGIGKGFAYVNFDTTGAVELALLKDGEVTLGKRVLRIQRCKTTKKRGKKSKNKSLSAGKIFEKKDDKPSSPPKISKKKKSFSTPSPSKISNNEKSFTGVKAAEKGKTKKKQGQKKMSFKKKAAVETLLNTMTGTATQKKSPKGFDRYFKQ